MKINKCLILLCFVSILLTGCEIGFRTSYCSSLGYSSWYWENNEMPMSYTDKDFYCVNDSSVNDQEGVNSAKLFIKDSAYNSWCEGRNWI